MTPPAVETVEIAPGVAVSRVVRGGWQLAGGHGPVERDRAVADMAAFVEAGVAAFDCADIYTGVEAMIGAFRAARPDLAARMRVHTKCVPDLAALPTLAEADVRRTVDRSRARLGMERLDLVQFHWWDYAAPGMERAALVLARMREEGAVALLGGTNFDAPRAEALLRAGVPLATMQVQYSLLDRRPEGAMADLCARNGTRLLCYGALAGGFLTDRWLGADDPGFAHPNRSLVKYRLIVEECGGWPVLQSLLRALRRVGDRRGGASSAAVATRWVLDRPQVAAAIVGARYAAHLPDTLSVFALRLDDEDRAELDEAMGGAARRGPGGDCYALERDRDGPHGRIMKYNLNDA